MSSSNTAHLLWTGGWDSTFRLLDLLLVKQRVVKPFYLISFDRPSFAVEIRTLRILKTLLFAKAPECKSRLRPTEFKAVSDINPNAAITERFNRLKGLGYLGNQYEYLARFANEAELYDLELSIHKDDKAHGFLEHSVTREYDGSDSFYRLQTDPSNPDLQVFKYFRFPLFDMTKLDMQQLSARYGFDDIMEHTWFCHKPLRNERPCGTCEPCRYTVEEGLGRRLSLKGRARYFLGYRVIRSKPVREGIVKLMKRLPR